MPANQNNPAPVDFFGLTASEFDTLAAGWKWPRFRAAQVRDWVYQKAVLDFAGMTNLSKRDREELPTRLQLLQSSIVSQQVSEDGTVKLLLAWPDGSNAETVMIPDGPRRTACISSQVGCPVGCHFCASGVNGVKGNLSAHQIVEQVMRLNQVLKPAGEHITNVVFMGMGEPLANYANVLQSVHVLHDPAGLNISARKITVSTVGVPQKIIVLASEQLPLNLALSLHAPVESLRKQLIPWAEHFSLTDIMNACRHYFDQTGREITLEYILLSGVNDQPEQAKQLAKLCKTIRANVNLIRYNEVAGLPFKRPKSDDVMAFQEILRASGVNAHVRKSRGRDIDAACGQLRRKAEEQAAAAGKTGLPILQS